MPRNQKIEPSAPSWQIDNGLVRAGFGWDGVVPGFALDRLDRQEEREQRQLERQREGERQDRAERRYELQFAEAAHWAAIRGEPFDPRNWRKHLPTIHDALAAEDARDRAELESEKAKLRARLAALGDES